MTPNRPGPRRQRGVVLIAALAVLLMLTFLSIGMFRSYGLEERIAGNSREKQHAFYAAQSSLQYAENWLLQNGSGTGAACPGTSTSPVICTLSQDGSGGFNPVTFNFATTNWQSSYGTTYQPTQIVTGSSTSTGQAAYAPPQYAINYLGPDPSSSGASLYQVTSIGYGANENSVAVVQSVYSVMGTTGCKNHHCD